MTDIEMVDWYRQTHNCGFLEIFRRAHVWNGSFSVEVFDADVAMYTYSGRLSDIVRAFLQEECQPEGA